jgi:predicted ABC-class ATPase
MARADDLRKKLHRIDNRGYPAYKEIKGRYDFPDFRLWIDHVQGDPYASPSRLRVTVDLQTAGVESDLLDPAARRSGLCAHLARRFTAAAAQKSGRKGSGKSGLLTMAGPQQEVLETSALTIHDGCIEARFFAGLPARGRRILGRRAAEMLLDDLPQVVQKSLFFQNLEIEAVRRSAYTNEDAAAGRRLLAKKELIAFVADGAVLPRASGIDQRPLTENAVPFRSPPSLRVTLTLPNAGAVQGMGIPRGVTLIVGGGFHGKSTLLEALERGVYNHCPGDGRECVVTDETAVKIRAEDGRAVSGVDISAFINDLPGNIDTSFFSTQNGSGSTSQATNIMEALEIGANVLLVDEDTSATNFMIRDSRMQALIAKEKEPITPFVDKVRHLWKQHGVSTVLVMGGSGDYFDTADTVIAMEAYVPVDVTERARKIVSTLQSQRNAEGGNRFGPITPRCPTARSINPRKGKKRESVKSRGVKTVLFGTEEIDLSAISQIVHPNQLRAIGMALLKLQQRADTHTPLAQLLAEIEQALQEKGLDWLSRHPVGDLSVFRRFELAAALNRLRTLKVTTSA